jgi:hypothetical protein
MKIGLTGNIFDWLMVLERAARAPRQLLLKSRGATRYARTEAVQISWLMKSCGPPIAEDIWITILLPRRWRSD